MIFIGYRPTFQCSSSNTFENITLTTNSSYFVSYDKCHIKVLYNGTAKKTHTLVKETTCFEGYQYSPENDRSYVTEVFVTVIKKYEKITLLELLTPIFPKVGLWAIRHQLFYQSAVTALTTCTRTFTQVKKIAFDRCQAESRYAFTQSTVL